MATHDAQSSRTVSDGLTTVESPPAEQGAPRKDTRWFVELAEVLEPLSWTGQRAFYAIGIVILGSFGIAYWGAYTEHLNIAVGAVIAFLLAMGAWTVATGWRLWTVLRGGVRWWRNRRRGSELTNSEPG